MGMSRADFLGSSRAHYVGNQDLLSKQVIKMWILWSGVYVSYYMNLAKIEVSKYLLSPLTFGLWMNCNVWQTYKSNLALLMYEMFELGCAQVCMCMHTHTHVPRYMEPRGQWYKLPKALSARYLLASHLPMRFLFSMHVPTIAIFQGWESQEKPEQSRYQCMLSGS